MIRSLDHCPVPEDVSHGERASKTWDLEILDTQSMPKAVSFLSATALISSGKEGVEDTFIPVNKDDVSLPWSLQQCLLPDSEPSHVEHGNHG